MESNTLIKEEINQDKEENKGKLKLPKRKFAIIHGYSGHKFCGNQK